MTTNPSPITSANGSPFGAQLPAFRAAAALATLHPEFTGAYVTFSQHYPNEVSVQADSFAALEEWREALNVAPDDVQTRECRGDLELYFRSSLLGAVVKVYAMELVVVEAPAVAA